MKNRASAVSAITIVAAGFPALADYKVAIDAIDPKGAGARLGTVTISEAKTGGVQFVPDLKGLPPGKHGFHVHEFGNCGAKEKGGKMSAGEMAGNHFDPRKTQQHAGPLGRGHAGDLPVLEAAADGTAKKALTNEHLTLRQLQGKTLVIHEGGDNYSDQPKANGGGGTRIACGVIEAGAK